MGAKEPRSLPDWIKEAYEILTPHITGSDDGPSRERAQELLINHDDFPNEKSDAIHAINRLLNTGWLYEVNDELYVTDS